MPSVQRLKIAAQTVVWTSAAVFHSRIGIVGANPIDTQKK